MLSPIRKTVIALLLLLSAAGRMHGQDAARWTDDDSMLGFFQALRELSARSIHPASVDEISRASLNAYLDKTDPHARYLSSTEYRLVREAMSPSYGGVGMELSQMADGRLRCLPYPDSPAEQAGIREGDLLTAVNGSPVPPQEPLLLTGARVRGPEGSTVRLSLRRPGVPTYEVTIARARVRSRTVLRTGSNIWRILVFETTTPQELREALGEADPNEFVTLDLRGNPGGSLAAAVESARLFLTRDAAIVSVKTRAGIQLHQGRSDAPFLRSPGLLLWQDQHTASAAEVFIAALTANNRALSVGQTTFGKGTTQRTTELVNGAALIFTDGWLLTPGEKEYDSHGLPPDVSTAGSATIAYSAATTQAIARLKKLVNESADNPVKTAPAGSPLTPVNPSKPPPHQTKESP